MSRPLLLLSHLLSDLPLLPYSDREKAGFPRTKWFMTMGRGYEMEQSTRPQTLGYAFADSPVGLAAWIYEKLVQWTDAYAWDDDEALTWISLYYFSRAGPAASLRIYYESTPAVGGPNATWKEERTTIPVGYYSHFPKEIVHHPRSWTKKLTLVFSSEHESGGHFAAHEKPRELVGDLRKMFGGWGRRVWGC